MSKILPVTEKMHAKTGFVILGKQTDMWFMADILRIVGKF